jgi:hypothetical protein
MQGENPAKDKNPQANPVDFLWIGVQLDARGLGKQDSTQQPGSGNHAGGCRPIAMLAFGDTAIGECAHPGVEAFGQA